MKNANWLALTSPLLFFIAACSSGGVSGSSGSGGSSSTTTTTATTTSGSGSVAAACVAPSLCPDIHYADSCTYGSGSGGATSEYGADDVTAAECLLTKMRAHEVGTVNVTHEAGLIACGMDGSYTEMHLVGLGDGTISYQNRLTGPAVMTTVSMPVRLALKSKAFFDDCLAATDPGDKVRCVLAMTEADLAPGEECPTFWP